MPIPPGFQEQVRWPLAVLTSRSPSSRGRGWVGLPGPSWAVGRGLIRLSCSEWRGHGPFWTGALLTVSRLHSGRCPAMFGVATAPLPGCGMTTGVGRGSTSRNQGPSDALRTGCYCWVEPAYLMKPQVLGRVRSNLGLPRSPPLLCLCHTPIIHLAICLGVFIERLLSAGLGARAGDVTINKAASESAVKRLLFRQDVHTWSPGNCQMLSH